VKLLHVTVQFQYADAIEEIFDRHELANFVRYSMIAGRDKNGKHANTQVFPGSLTVLQARLPDETVDDVLESLTEFRDAKEAHEHLEALVLPVERVL
jgi:hypothetical protein